MTTPQQFEIQPLSQGDRLIFGKDIRVFENGNCALIEVEEDSLVVNENIYGNFYRISLKQPTAPDAKETPQTELPSS